MKPLTRRSFIKWVIASGAAMACPFPAAAEGEPKKRIDGETNEVCHKVRDGFAFPAPPPSRSVGTLIIGAGPAGLGAADHLLGSDFLVLEKEPRVGGNAVAGEWNGLKYSTGSAWMALFSPRIKELFGKWKLSPPEIGGYDSAWFEDRWIKDFWDAKADSPRIEELPYGRTVKQGFRDFIKELDALDLDAQKDKLDAMTFFDFMQGKPEPLIRYWDAFGLSNWGASTTASSAYAGVLAARDWPRSPRFTFEGGLGVVPPAVFASFPLSDQRKFLFGATVYKVKQDGGGALVWFMRDGKPDCVRARSVIFCAPKFIAARVVEGLPKPQKDAMLSMRYAPFPTYSLCFTKRVCDLGYDSYVVGAKAVCDLIQADWVTKGRSSKPSDPQVLTLYAPMREGERADLLDDEETVARAERAAAEVLATLPGAERHLAEVRIYRRGHAMPMSVPNWYTKVQKIAKADLGPVSFAHSDSTGEISDLEFAMLAGIEAAEKAAKRL